MICKSPLIDYPASIESKGERREAREPKLSLKGATCDRSESVESSGKGTLRGCEDESGMRFRGRVVSEVTTRPDSSSKIRSPSQLIPRPLSSCCSHRNRPNLGCPSAAQKTQSSRFSRVLVFG